MTSGINWTDVIDTAIVAIPATVAAYAGVRNGRRLRLPSGGTIGEAMERTHDMTAVGVAAVTGLGSQSVADSERRLDADPASPIKPNGEHKEE